MKKPYKLLPPMRPSSAINAEYQKALLVLIRKMQDSVMYYCVNAYKPLNEEQKEINKQQAVLDEEPIDRLQKAINAVKRRYFKKFRLLADDLAKYIVDKINKNVSKRNQISLKEAIKELEISPKFSVAKKLVLKAAVKENVALIRSIPSLYFKRVEYDLMSSVMSGRNLSDLTDKLQKGYGIARRRAITIAYDQTNKITSNVDKQEKLSLGLTKAIWRHSNVPQEPRHSHVLANGKEYDIRKGCYIDGEYIQPAQKINCNCFSQAILKI